MPILRVSEIRKMSNEERERRLMELRTELMRARTIVKAGGALDNPSRIRELRRAIARILTVMNEEKRTK
ncbi:50S ribosomal protein L29 [Candidatus Bathyarchaeota archaeon]|nr:50S ribosomal protein L29 [Candidatus Bathyarchaeota archaeon]MCD6592867.1 50S ribosomal protein L29 [Candidatus Bathyarchaeota archaeon]